VAEAERILSQNEVDALLSAIDSGAQVGGGDEAAVAYDFRHPARLGRERIRALHQLHEGFARGLQSALSGLLRAPAEAKVAGVHALSIKEALHSLPRPTVLAVLSCEPLEGYVLLDMNPSVAGLAVERLLGSGKAGSPGEPRALTALEWGVYETLLGTVLDLLREAWSPLASPAFRVLRRESDPGALQLPRMEEMGVMVVLELVLGDQRGSLDLVFPVHTVEPCLDRLQTLPAAASGKAAGEGDLPGRLSPAEVSVTAHLPTETARMGDIRDLRPGDLIVSSHPAAAPVLVSVEGCAKFEARLGRMKDRRAARIERGAPAEEPARGRATSRPAAGEARSGEPPAVEALLAVPLPASVVLAEKRAPLSELLSLRPGDLIAFERRADAPLELRVGGRKIAEGAAVRVGERFGLKVVAVSDARDRVRALGT
jgi:flagellar motor switch protein FliM